MTSASREVAFPEVVWDAPALRGLDARARHEIEAAGRTRTLRAGETLYRAGDPADALFVVVRGAVTLSGVRRGEPTPTVIRSVRHGEIFGEEAIVTTFASRQLEARCDAEATIAELPMVVLRRAVGRAGGVDVLARLERSLRRAVTMDLLRTASFCRAFPESDRELLLDAAHHHDVARGAHVFREGDPSTEAFIVADGLLQVQTSDTGQPRVEAYLSRGDIFGHEELEIHDHRRVSVVAAGPAHVVAIPRDVFVSIARRNALSLAAVTRVRTEPRPPPAAGYTTAHVFQDVYRMRIARSLLVIDQDSCIRCGHCASSCASAHDDGISRLVRRGDKMVVRTEDSEARAPLLVPNSCQHCKNPSCMIDCPTGAIGRDARGEVFIREDLCTGCGNCAKGCPWDNIQIAPRSQKSAPFPEVAVKCDLCKGRDGGPACVAECPTQAIARIEPSTALVELRLGANAGPAPDVLPRRTALGPWLGGAALSAAGFALLATRLSPLGSGIAAGTLFSLSVLYPVAKRAPGMIGRLRARHRLARALYLIHMALATIAAGVAIAHSGMRVPANAAGGLVLAFAGTVVTGVVGGVLARFVPRMLTRVERKSLLPEELGPRLRELDEQMYRALSGKTEVTKTLFVKVLRPYRRARFGPLALVASRRTLRQEERRVRTKLELLLGGRKSERAHGTDELLRIVVEHRAIRAQRGLTYALRGWVFPHVAASVAALVLGVLHVVGVLR